MIEKNFRSLGKIILLPIAKALTVIGVTANMITIVGLLVNAIAAFFLATGRLVVAGILILFGGCFDAMDGVVARFSGKDESNASGALLDSVIDRYSEAVIFLGAMIYFYHLSHRLGVILVFASVIGSILVSYVRARAEGLQVECKVGLMQRPERIALLALGLLVQGFIVDVPWASNGIILVCVFAFLALTAHVTALYRLVFAFSRLNSGSSD
ncbi:MAG: CDP-alcohol phosphatidyltransferase family protein [Candidatus Poribacteria bacterium]|nr:CDP-alcohol phosphatidyltransferase family protein [Candidatus Poribacteria bacterium]MDE0504888.1 CDP-alcohol phosphatidyltransferase family protein [Candidatus Poribacteria bacterium]